MCSLRHNTGERGLQKPTDVDGSVDKYRDGDEEMVRGKISIG